MGQLPGGFGLSFRQLRPLLQLLTVLACWLLPARAEAARAGMCGPTAQSIEAPPPLYAVRETRMEDCSHRDAADELAAGTAEDAPPRAWAPGGPQHELGLAPSELRIARASTTRAPLPPTSSVVSEEHRSALLRPPAL